MAVLEVIGSCNSTSRFDFIAFSVRILQLFWIEQQPSNSMDTQWLYAPLLS